MEVKKMSEEKQEDVDGLNETIIGRVLVGATIATMWILYFWSLGIFYSILPLWQWLSIHVVVGAFSMAVTLYMWNKV